MDEKLYRFRTKHRANAIEFITMTDRRGQTHHVMVERKRKRKTINRLTQKHGFRLA